MHWSLKYIIMVYILLIICSILTGCDCSVKPQTEENIAGTNHAPKEEQTSLIKVELEDILNEIARKVPLASDSIGFTMAYLEEPFQIVVALKDTSAENITRFKREVVDSPVLVFKLGGDIIFE